MDCYLEQHPPRRSQFRAPRRRKPFPRPTGLTVIHTAETITDFAGPDLSAESVARFIRNRNTPGSYHDLVDSDSCLHLVRYENEAYQDGTGSNPFALSISFALKAADWSKLKPSRRAAFLHQGAQAFARQQRWLQANGYPTTPLRFITKAESNVGEAGFIEHGKRDPGRRSDPGPDFPYVDWLRACAAAIATDQEDDVARLISVGGDKAPIYGTDGTTRWHAPDPDVLADLIRSGVYGSGQVTIVAPKTIDALPLVEVRP